MNTLIISIGSNYNSEENIKLCRDGLRTIFQAIHFSSTSVTKPFGSQYKNNFLNQLVLTQTDQDFVEIQKQLKLLEKEIGRKKGDKTSGLVKIDIDIIKWNDVVTKEKDWQRNYVQDLLPSLYENADLD